jgi:hypothetical protein
MSFDFRNRRSGFAGYATMRHGSACIMCALLLVLSANARFARNEIRQHTLKPAPTHTYLDSEETLRKLPKGAVLLFWSVGFAAYEALRRPPVILLTAAVPGPTPFQGFDPALRFRPPPVR